MEASPPVLSHRLVEVEEAVFAQKNLMGKGEL